jgi:FAD/FMN-containing dehydrogenase
MIKEEIRNFIKGDIADDEAALKKYSRDASLFEIWPQLVVFPRDIEDLKFLVKFASKRNANKLSLTPRAAGSDMTGGPLGESIIVDFTRYFNQIREFGEDYAVVQPGMLYRDFERATLKRGLLLPSYPASREICAVGGMVANNSGGEKTLAYGQTKDYIRELKVVLRDGNEYIFRPLSLAELQGKMVQPDFEGEIYRRVYELVEKNYDLVKNAKPRVSKNSAGYYLWDVWDRQVFDLTKLFAGSQGTLGLITEIKFRLIRPKKYSRLLIIFMRDLQPLGLLINEILKFKPESLESFDNHTFKLVLRYFPTLLRLMKNGNIFSLIKNFLPEFWMALSGGIPKLILLAEFTADSEEAARDQALTAQTALKGFNLKTRVTQDENESRKYWVMRRESFNLLRYHLKNKRTAPFIDDFVVRPDSLPQFLPELNKILSRYDLVYTIAGHPGDGNFHVIPLMDFSDPKSREIIPVLAQEVYELALKFSGSISGEHNDGLIRGPYLKQMYGERVYQLFEKTKQIFDPDNIFNPGKKIGVSLSYALEHLIK